MAHNTSRTGLISILSPVMPIKVVLYLPEATQQNCQNPMRRFTLDAVSTGGVRAAVLGQDPRASWGLGQDLF